MIQTRLAISHYAAHQLGFLPQRFPVAWNFFALLSLSSSPLLGSTSPCFLTNTCLSEEMKYHLSTKSFLPLPTVTQPPQVKVTTSPHCRLSILCRFPSDSLHWAGKHPSLCVCGAVPSFLEAAATSLCFPAQPARALGHSLLGIEKPTHETIANFKQ